MLKFITENFWVFFLVGMLSGIFIKGMSRISPYIIYILMFVFLLSSLRIDLEDVFKKAKNVKLVIYLVSLILISVPIIVYFIFKPFLTEDYSLAILVLLVMPAGMAVPVYSTIFKGDKELALILSTITSLLSPITIPFMIYLLSGVKASLDIIRIFISLAMIILIPFILAITIRRFALKIVEKTERYYSAISIIGISFIMAGAVAKINFLNIIMNKNIILPFLSLFILAIILTAIGYICVYNKDRKTRITSALALSYINSTLAIVLAAEFFSAGTLFLVTLYQIPTNLILMLFGYYIKKHVYNFI